MSNKRYIPMMEIGEGFIPAGNLPINITENGTQQFEVTQYQFVTVNINVPNDTESLSVTENGTYTPSSPNIGFERVSVNVPQPHGTLQQNINRNGVYTYDVTDYEYLEVTVNIMLQTKSIDSNGTYRPATGYAGFSEVTVNVPNSVQGLNVTQNGTYTPTSPNIGFNRVSVDVPNGVQGLNVTRNGTYTPSSPNIGFSEVSVNVPASAVDSGTKQTTITTNGTQTIDVTGYANHKVITNITEIEPDYFWVRIRPGQGVGQANVKFMKGDLSYTTDRIYKKQSGDSDWVEMPANGVNLVFPDTVYFKGYNKYISSGTDYTNNTHIKITGAQVDIGGDITTLLTDVGKQDFLPDYCFYGLFKDVTYLKDASALVLPSRYMGVSCYESMFEGCTALNVAPRNIPSLYLKNKCCYSMFERTKITESPIIGPYNYLFTNYYTPSTDPFGYMFYNCTYLKKITCLQKPGTQISRSWVNGVANSGTFYKSSDYSESDWGRGVNGIPVGWTVLDA